MGKLFGGRKPDYTRIEPKKEEELEPRPEDLGLPPMPKPPQQAEQPVQQAQAPRVEEDEVMALMDYHLGKFLEYYQEARK